MKGATTVRCEACELTAARMAYAAGLGASEWPAFIDRIAPCDDCRKVAVLRGRPANPFDPEDCPYRHNEGLCCLDVERCRAEVERQPGILRRLDRGLLRVCEFFFGPRDSWAWWRRKLRKAGLLDG